MMNARENVEDDPNEGIQELKKLEISSADVVVGISAAGGAAYVCNALYYAQQIGCTTVGITSNSGSKLDQIADISIAVDTGPEVLTGSTRLKAGNVQKMILNMLSTGAMIKLGKVYGNLMVDVKPSNEKLIRRCVTIVCAAAECDEATAVAALEACGYRPKTAIVMVLCGVDADTAVKMLQKADGRIAGALKA